MNHSAPPNAAAEQSIAVLSFKPEAAPPEPPPEALLPVDDGKLIVFEINGGKVGAGSWEPPPPFRVKVDVEALLGTAEAPRPVVVLFAAPEFPKVDDAPEPPPVTTSVFEAAVVGFALPLVFGVPFGGFVCVALYCDCAAKMLEGTGATLTLKDEHSRVLMS